MKYFNGLTHETRSYFLVGLGLISTWPLSPSPNHLLYSIKQWGPTFEVTFDLKIHRWPQPDENGQILQLIERDHGQRAQGLWTAKEEGKVIVSFESVQQQISYTFQLGERYNVIISKKKEKVTFLKKMTFFI